MARIFLGRASHWLLLVLVIVVLYTIGATRLHVRDFNGFVLLVLGVAIALVFALRHLSRPGEQITRDP